MSSNVDFHFAPGGEPLGSSGAPSAPEDIGLGFENPAAFNKRRMKAFTAHMRQRYHVNDPNMTLHDPRGQLAVSPNPSDYLEGMMIDRRAPEADLEAVVDAQLERGIPTRVPYEPKTYIDAVALKDPSLALSDRDAVALARALEVQSAKVVGTLQVGQGLPDLEIANELGLVTKHGGIPDTFQDIDVNNGADLTSAAINLMSDKQIEAQVVDANGVVSKYSPGTGPYDNPGQGIPGGMNSAVPGTMVDNGVYQVAKTHNTTVTRGSFGQLPDAVDTQDVASEGGGGLSTPHIIGFVGAAGLGLVGLGLLFSGIKG